MIEMHKKVGKDTSKNKSIRYKLIDFNFKNAPKSECIII